MKGNWALDDAKVILGSGYLPVKLAGMILVAASFALISFDLFKRYGEEMREGSPLIYYLIVLVLFAIGIVLNLYAFSKKKRITQQLGPGAYSQTGTDLRPKSGRGRS